MRARAGTYAASQPTFGRCEGGAQVRRTHRVLSHALEPPDYPRLSTFNMRVLPSVLGFTRARSRNSATPSSVDRTSSA
jgi:hypothetical protein